MTDSRKAELHERGERTLTNQAPIDEAVIDLFESIRGDAKTLWHTIVSETPITREQSLALTALEECVMWAIKAVALHQEQALAEMTDPVEH